MGVGTYIPVSWARYVPGPSPTYRYKGLSPRTSRSGVVACGCACLMLSGLNVALMGSVSSIPSYLARIGLDDGTKHSELLIGVVNAIYWVGVIIGALLISPISDSIGRRRALVCAGVYAMFIIPIFAGLQNFAWALSLRFLNGLATGAFDAVGLNWSAESSASNHRGRAIGLHMCCAALGASQSYFLTVRRTWSALFVQFATQAMVGVGVVSGYGIKIFQTGGWSNDLAALLSGVGIVIQAAFGFPGAFCADKIGRRNAFIYGALAGSVLLAFIGMCGHFVANNVDTDLPLAKSYSSAVVALVMIWSAQFGLTWCKYPLTKHGTR
ncbi:major facilitator superfamily domain-containing protein [Ilyonectria robusta]|uniref:major facilitator superfamily domain-containing protein n=1 Tax=Ilyonectria robusta TaxID=1079257 RepID=UPI001E8E445C|nr:major facilitator superfamily domain-containing protein [Ilyonectria robusta]KAH8667705.1 major facilitator superfamily domain-containing protein [Ilyonectria robusta]